MIDNTPPYSHKETKENLPAYFFCVRVYVNQNVFIKAYNIIQLQTFVEVNILRYSPIINEVITCV